MVVVGKFRKNISRKGHDARPDTGDLQYGTGGEVLGGDANVATHADDSRSGNDQRHMHQELRQLHESHGDLYGKHRSAFREDPGFVDGPEVAGHEGDVIAGVYREQDAGDARFYEGMRRGILQALRRRIGKKQRGNLQ